MLNTDNAINHTVFLPRGRIMVKLQIDFIVGLKCVLSSDGIRSCMLLLQD